MGDVCRGSFWMRGNAPDGIMVRFKDGDKILAEQKIKAPSAQWIEFPLALDPNDAADDAVLEIVALGKASVWLDQVSLMPDSYKANGGFRTDLLKAVTDLSPQPSAGRRFICMSL